MDVITYSTLRSNLASILNKVYEETSYLKASNKNAERLNKAIEEIEAGKTVKFKGTIL